MSAPSGRPRVVVVGGGITGLAAAHRIIETAPDVEVRVLESTSRLGGQVGTVRHDGCLLETGPDTVLTQKPAGIALCERLGLGGDVEDLAARHTGTEVVRAGRLVRVPDGFVMMAPVRVRPLLVSPLFSWPAKLRMLVEPWISKRPADREDESLASFVSRRFGREVLDRVAEPVLAGLHTADAARLSLRVAMPRLLDLEASEGNVTRPLRRASKAAAHPAGHGTGRGAFAAVRGGLGRIVDALSATLPAPAVALDMEVAGLTRTDGAWRIHLGTGGSLVAEGVVLACPAFEAARIVREADETLSRTLSGQSYASCATVTLAYRREAVGAPPAGFGFFVPRVEGLPLLACTNVGAKFPDRVPEGLTVLRAFVGGATNPAPLAASDAALAGSTHAALAGLLEIAGEPVFARIDRHVDAMPQYEVGAARRIEGIAARVSGHPGLVVAGSAVGAVGLPDCIRSGEDAAERAAAAARDHFSLSRRAG